MKQPLEELVGSAVFLSLEGGMSIGTQVLAVDGVMIKIHSGQREEWINTSIIKRIEVRP